MPAGLGLLLLLVGLVVRSAGFVGVALAVLGAEYVVGLSLSGPTLRWSAAAYGGVLLAIAELSYASLGPTASIAADPAVEIRRAAGIGSLLAAGLVVGGMVEAVAEAKAGGGVPLTLIGAAGAVLVLVLLLWLSARAAEQGRA